jgi:hypothetical protein
MGRSIENADQLHESQIRAVDQGRHDTFPNVGPVASGERTSERQSERVVEKEWPSAVALAGGQRVVGSIIMLILLGNVWEAGA